jgi:hypothetical protein
MRWRRLSKYVVLAGLAVAPPSAAESLLDKLLRISGLTASPAQMRAPDVMVEAGNIWIADLDRRTARAVTTGGGYQFAHILSGKRKHLRPQRRCYRSYFTRKRCGCGYAEGTRRHQADWIRPGMMMTSWCCSMLAAMHRHLVSCL